MADNKPDSDNRKSGGDFAQFLDREQEITISEHSRPHWMQAGTITFITMRLADSIPREVVIRWDRERLEFLFQHGIQCSDWRKGRERLSEQDRIAFNKHFRRMREDELDLCHGKCQLRDPVAATIVAKSLMHFDNDRYLMGDFVVMPNHIHFLAVFVDDDALRKQCYSWMKFTATQINQLNGDKGTFWQEEPIDHLVRSEKQLIYLRDYIEQNPVNANLREGEFLYRRSSRQF